MKWLWSVLVIALVFCLSGCQPAVDFEAEKAKIMEMIKESDEALLTGKKAEPDTGGATALNLIEGRMERLTATDVVERNKDIKERAKWVGVENIDGPEIHFSPDGMMAWVAVRTKFTLAYKDDDGKENQWEGVESRLMVYEKIDGEWHVTVTAQTH